MNNFQTDKLIPIKLPEICAPRQELLTRFNAASNKRFIYIHAPGGCGKTVSTLLWIQKSGCTPIWLGLDAYDNTPAVFYRFFCSSLFSVMPQEEGLSRIITEAAFNDSPVEYTIEIISRFVFDSRKYALVLDDFYFITNEEILKSLVYILKRLPLSITVIILSRSELPSFFAPLNESGKISFIDNSDLAFKSEEIRRFFSSYGRFITEKEAERAFTLTEGWAIAVSALALSGKITADHKLDSGFLDAYLKTQIWDKFDRKLRLFLFETSVVDEFNVKLCERLTKNPDAEQILNMLCEGNMFISRQNDTYRYHQLFLNFLRREAEKEKAVKYDVQYRTAADYYFEEGKYFDALRYFVKTDNSKGTAAALYHFWNRTGKSSSELSRISFINELPANYLERNPYLYVSCAWYALFFSNASNFFFHLDRLYEHIHDIVNEYDMFVENMLFLFTIDHRYTFTQQMAKLPANGEVPINAFNVPKSQCQYFPFYHRTHRDYSYYALNTEENFAEFRLVFFMMLGGYYQIIESGVRAGLLYEKNQLKESFSLVTPNPDTDSDELIFLSKVQVASCLLAMGKEEDSARCRKEIKEFLDAKNLLYLIPIFSAYETKIKLLDGDKAAAAAWLDNYFITDSQKIELHRIFLHFTTVRAYIVLGEYKKAEVLCERIKALSNDFGRLLDRIEATVLMIILKWITDRKQEAVDLLSNTLKETGPYYFVRVFADEGKAILPILSRLRKKVNTGSNRSLDSRYLFEIYQAAYERSKRHKGIACTQIKPIKLSGRQKSVLEFLAKGYKNAEIVEMTGLSLNTIRSHTKVIYQKLEVNTAIDAVLRARELELIE